jgi:hypothetical protein
MNDQTTTEVTPLFVPDQRPVRRFVAAIAVVALALAALWWSGAFAPRLGLLCRDRAGIASDAETVRFELENASPLPVQILGVASPGEAIDASRVDVGHRRLPEGGVRLSGGEKVALEFDLDRHLVPDRAARNAALPPPELVRAAAEGLRIVVRTVAGGERHVWVGSMLSDWSGYPPLEQSRS